MLQSFFPGIQTQASFSVIISTALAIAIIFQPLQKLTQGLLDKLFFRKKYNSQELLADLSNIFTQTLDLDILVDNFLNKLVQVLQIEKAAFFFLNQKTGKLELIKNLSLFTEQEKRFTFLPFSLFDSLLSANKVLFREELKRNYIGLHSSLEKIPFELLVVLRSQSKLRGVLLLGSKLSDEPYSFEECELLEIVADAAALGFDNTFLFEQLLEEKEKVEEANTSLEIKVKARTKELRELTKGLDEKVREKTKELQQRVDELERFRRVTVGRELKMTELKKKNKELIRKSRKDFKEKPSE